MSFVLDSSVALTWCFEDEATAAADALLAQVTDSGAHAPLHWPLEVLNALAMSEQRGRIGILARHEKISLLKALPIALDQETAAQACTTTTRLAHRYRLTLYDAAYLELAQRLNLPLATLDKQLREAATALGMTLLGISD